ncbi:MAG: hypothetical protein H7061_04255, partial [Bdellovibrionaceae bacterium]|nr:hypothetical protein [Bdellovibrio sp.]
PSNCVYLTTYIYDITAPVAPTYLSASPTTPTNQTIYPNIKGSASLDTALLRFYNGPLCLTMIGSGTKPQFESAGVSVSVDQNATTSVYAQAVDAAGNASTCQLMVNYKNNIIPPDIPVFGTTTPISPNNVSSTPFISGNASVTTVTIDFYSDDQCLNNIGSGTAAAFNAGGIQLITPNVPNAVNKTDVYARAKDPETNQSACLQLTTYAYSTKKAAAPTFFQSVPASPSRTTTTPFILGTAPISVSIVSLFKDNTCTTLIGTASRPVFASVGIQMTAVANIVTTVYALSTDVYGNSSDCTYFTDYIHDNTQPAAPVFTSSNPPSPTRITSSPLLMGTAVLNAVGKPLPTTQIKFYDSLLCLTIVGSGTITDFTAGVVQVVLAGNSISSIYGKTIDDAGNTSGCTFMLNFLHNTYPPGKPILASATPATPSYSNITTLKGTLGPSSTLLGASTITIYKDSACTTALKTSPITNFTGPGIKVVLDKNVVTPIYAKTFDSVGNESICNSLVDFAHSDAPPANLQVLQNPDGSALITWQNDTFGVPTAKYILKRSLQASGPYTIIANKITSSSFPDYNTSNGITYFYVVASNNVTGTSLDSLEVSLASVTGATTTPLALIGTVSTNTVKLSWTGAITNLYYEVYRSSQVGGPYTKIQNKSLSTSYTDTNVLNDTAYFYIVKGLNSTGRSFDSNELSVYVKDSPVGPTMLSAAAFNEHTACAGGPGVAVNWEAQDYYDMYQVAHLYIGGPGFSLAAGNITGNSYYFCRLPSQFGIRNDFEVRAMWGSFASPLSNVMNVSNQMTTVIANPGDNEIKLTWSPGLYDVDYQIWRSTVSGWQNSSYTQLQSNYVGASFTDLAVTNGTAYNYVIIPNVFYTVAMSGWPSIEVSATPGVLPANPTLLTVTKDITSPNPALTWAPTSHANKYNIYQSTAPGGPFSLVGVSVTNSFVDSPSSPGLYYYQVTGVWGNYETAPTNVVSYRYGVISNLGLADTASQFTLSWAPVTGASLYTIYRSNSEQGTYSSIGTTAGNSFINSTAAPAGFTISSALGYYYKVTPTFPDTTVGQNSNIVSGNLASASVPGGLSVTGTSSGSVDFAWSKQSGMTSYKMYQATAAGGPYVLVGTITSGNIFTAGGLTANTVYYFKLAYSSCGTGCLSTAVSTLAVSPPTAPIAVAGNNLIDVTWSGVIGAVTYDLLRSTDDVTYSALVLNASGGAYTDATAVNGQKYFFRLRVNYAGAVVITSVTSNAVVPGLAPLIPAGLQIVNNINGTDIGLDWTPVQGATGYNIYSSLTSGGPWAFVNYAGSPTGNFVLGLTTGTKYYFAVTALIGTIESTYSSQIAAIPSVQPSAPTVVVNGSTLFASWTGVAGAATYDVLRSTDGVYFTPLVNIAVNSYTDAAVSTGIAYYYKYLPRDASGTELSISLQSTSIQKNLPPPVSGLHIFATTNTSITIDWVSSYSPQVQNYRIYRSTTSGSGYTPLATIGTGSTKYTDSTPILAQNYYYVVTTINSYGAESVYSNESAIQFIGTVIDLVVTNSANKINLNWTADVLALSYDVFRSNITGGPYGFLANVSTNSYIDANLLNGANYFYVVRPVHAGGIKIAYSNEAAVTVSQRVNLSVPVEMLDQGIGSDTFSILFDRSETTINPADYDGTVTYDLEVVASNAGTSPHSIDIYDASAVLRGTVIIPASITVPKRFKANWIPNVIEDTYKLQLPATTSFGDLQIYSAKIWINQNQASRTKLYYPLLSSNQMPSSGDIGAPIETVGDISGIYTLVQNSSIFTRDTSRLKDLVDFNAWEFEALVSTFGSTGTLALYNIDTAMPVQNTESNFNLPLFQKIRATFDANVTEFGSINELQRYRLAMKCILDCDLGGLNIYKAGIWVRLENITEAEIFIRNSLGHDNVTAAAYTNEARTQINMALFSNPIVNFSATAFVTADPLASGIIELVSAGSAAGSDDGLAALTPVASSLLTDTTVDQTISIRTTVPISLVSNERYLTMVQASTGTIRILDSFIIIRIGL